jgi:hypothetical protein
MNHFVSRLVIVAVFLVSCPQSTSADIVWLGAGESGNDPFGTPWLFQNSGTAFQNVTSFGFPGRAKGTTKYFGSESVRAVELEFFGLPSGVVLTDFLPVNTPAMNVTPFSASDLWTYVFPTTTSIRFTPPTPDRTLDQSDGLLLWAPFSGDLNSSLVNFRATYVTGVPEPGGLSALAAVFAMCFQPRCRRS